jgi:hypothetical protein
MWHWLVHTSAGQTTRIVVGLSILLMLAVVDLYRHGRGATRWREYAFLLCTVAAAMTYGIINDQITSRISWEYYAYGKGLAPVLGDHIPPDARRLSWETAKVGMQATWAVGLLIGVVCLLANNPRRHRPRLSYRELLARVPWMIVITAITAALLGWVGYRGGLAMIFEDFREMVRLDQFRPRRFMAVYGIHLGGYIGGAVGTLVMVASILRARRAKNALSIGLDS